jgi:hypothetical protein
MDLWQNSSKPRIKTKPSAFPPHLKSLLDAVLVVGLEAAEALKVVDAGGLKGVLHVEEAAKVVVLLLHPCKLYTKRE